MKAIFKPVLALTVLFSALTAHAKTETYNLNVNVEAQVPNKTGLVVSPVGTWAGTTQTMFWDNVKDKLAPVNNQLFIKSGIGAVKAFLVAQPVLSAAGQNITLATTINGKVLDVGPTKSIEILPKTEATAGRVVNFSIEPAAATTYVQGNYMGQVQTVFESSDI